MSRFLKLIFIILLLVNFKVVSAQNTIRKDISLNADWVSIVDEKNINAFNGFELVSYKPASWKKVNVPHNWDQYEGYQRKLHGNKHGYAWYRKTF